jgi:hypothetical protein
VVVNVTSSFNGFLTVIGSNFGNNASVITFWVDTEVCKKVKIIVPHKQFTCQILNLEGTVPTRIDVDNNYNVIPSPNVTLVWNGSSSAQMQYTSSPNGPDVLMITVVTLVTTLVLITLLLSMAVYVARLHKAKRTLSKEAISEVSLDETIISDYVSHYIPVPVESEAQTGTHFREEFSQPTGYFTIKYNELSIDEAKPLGSGAFGEVTKASLTQTDRTYNRCVKLRGEAL